MRRTLILLLLIMILAAGLGYLAWFFGGEDFSGAKIPNILLISIDTCRADYLSCYGYSRKNTPNIDRMAKSGILCENVISPVPITLPAHSSILTGTNPPYLGIHNNYDHLGTFNVTLAELLKKNGFTTGAIISAFVLDSQFGMDQGFDSYNDQFKEKHQAGNIYERKGTETSRFAIEWLDKHKDEKFFLFLHYFDPHREYEPPEPFASEYASNLYAGEIAYTDHCIGQVISKLKKLGLYDSAFIIVTGDHGEMLGEHGEASHSYFIYQGAIRVPLIFKLPGKHKSKVIKKMIGLIDIAPTICGLLGIEVPSEVQGMDLSSSFGRKKLPDRSRYLYCESLEPTKYDANSLLGVVTDQWKYIQTTRPELYDLIKDPAESHNLLDSQHKQASLLKGHLTSIVKEQLRKEEADSRFELDEQALAKLRGLGYVGGSVDETFDFNHTKDDPKDLIDFHNLHMVATSHVSKKKYSEAEALCKKQFDQKPDFWGTHFNMALISRAQGNLSEAIKHLQEWVKLKPGHADAHENLAKAFQDQGKIDEAISHYQHALQINPNLAEVHNNLGGIFQSQDKTDEAISHYQHALQINPRLAETHKNLGSILRSQDKIDEAISHYQHALQINPRLTGIHNNLGNMLQLVGKSDEAIRHYQQALQMNPSNAKVHYNLGMLFQTQGRFDEAINHYSQALQFQPDNPLTHFKISILLVQKGKSDQAIKHLNEALRINPDWPKAHHELGKIYKLQGRFDLTISHWTETLRLKPDSIVVLNNLAWMLATIQDPKFQNSSDAVKFADKACELTNYQNPVTLDTLAAAYAAAGNFDQAVATAQSAIEQAFTADNEDLAGQINERLELYQQKKPYRDLSVPQYQGEE